jgi:hypothetical protein
MAEVDFGTQPSGGMDRKKMLLIAGGIGGAIALFMLLSKKGGSDAPSATLGSNASLALGQVQQQLLEIKGGMDKNNQTIAGFGDSLESARTALTQLGLGQAEALSMLNNLSDGSSQSLEILQLLKDRAPATYHTVQQYITIKKAKGGTYTGPITVDEFKGKIKGPVIFNPPTGTIKPGVILPFPIYGEGASYDGQVMADSRHDLDAGNGTGLQFITAPN